MSVSLTAEPLEAIPAGNSAIFSLQLSGQGIPPEKKSIGYRLWSGTGVQLTETEQIPYTGAAEDLNVALDIKRKLLSTTLLGYGVSAVTEDAEAVKAFYITYGEITYNEDECIQSQDISGVSPTKYGLNATFPWYIDPASLPGGASIVLSERPARVGVYKGQQDWLHIYRHSGVISVTVRGYDSAGNLIVFNTNNKGANKSVFIFPVGPGNSFFTWNEDIAYYDITVGSWSCRFTLKSCDVSPPNNEVYFQEPMGGYSAFRFLNVQGGANTSSQRYRKGKPCSAAFPALGQSYGATRYNLQSFPGYAMQTEIDYEDGIERWIEAFFAAENHFMKFQMPDGSYQYQKVNLVDGAYSTLNNKDVISLNASFEAHMSRV